MADFFKTNFTKIKEAVASQRRDPFVQKWLLQVDDALKREKKFREDGAEVVKVYESTAQTSAGDEYAYNVLYANTETLAPAIYNSIPRPRVRQRYKDNNKLAYWGAQVGQRTLEFLANANQPEYQSYDDLNKNAVLQALVPGRGASRFKYEANFIEVPGEDESKESPAEERVENETVCGETVEWNRLILGYATHWNKVPWIAFEHFMTREECVKNFGEIVGSKIEFTAVQQDGDKKEQQPIDAEGVKFAHIYEIWDKASKKVLFISSGYDNPIKIAPDPLKLEGFFPIPEPLGFFDKVSSMVPKPLFLMYQEQARELNSITIRIGKLTRAMKIRGFYDSTLQGIDDLMQKEDNTLLPAQNVPAIEGRGLDGSIWLMPIDKMITVLQQLYINRQQVKGVIYEVMGIADIMRGSSQASETLGAQELKQQWGSMRLKRMQKEVMRYTREEFRIILELACTHFEMDTFRKMTGLELPTEQEQKQAQQFLAQVQQAAQAMQMQQQQAQQASSQQPQQPGMPPQGGPQQGPPQQQSQAPQMPPMPPPPPEQMEKAQEMVDKPTWEAVLGFMKDDLQRNFVIDIETNSTIDAEVTEDKQDVSEFMNAMGQFLNGIMPLVQEGTMPFEVAKELLIALCQRFRFGDDVMEKLRQMQPPKMRPDPKTMLVQAQMQMAQEAHAADMEAKQASLQGQQQLVQQQLQSAQQISQMKMDEIQARVQGRTQEVQAKVQGKQSELAFSAAEHEQDAQQEAQEHLFQMAANQQSHHQLMQQQKEIGDQKIAQAKAISPPGKK